MAEQPKTKKRGRKPGVKKNPVHIVVTTGDTEIVVHFEPNGKGTYAKVSDLRSGESTGMVPVNDVINALDSIAIK